MDHVTDNLVSKLIDSIKKKEKKGGITIKPFQVKNHLWVFVNALIENPTFDSQTKETMTLQAKSFGSKCQVSDKFILNVSIATSWFVHLVIVVFKIITDDKSQRKCKLTSQYFNSAIICNVYF